MIRAALSIVGLTAWLSVALGLRAWLGGKAYLQALIGDTERVDSLMELAGDLPEAGLLLGMDPWTLLLAFSVSISAVLVLLVLWPSDALLMRLGVGPRARALVAVGLAMAATAAALLSVHPLLSLPQVPEGPRTALNYACEAAGYGWINAIAYVGGIGTALAFTWLGAREQAYRAEERAAASAGADADADAEQGADAQADDAEEPEAPAADQTEA